MHACVATALIDSFAFIAYSICHYIAELHDRGHLMLVATLALLAFLAFLALFALFAFLALFALFALLALLALLALCLLYTSDAADE